MRFRAESADDADLPGALNDAEAHGCDERDRTHEGGGEGDHFHDGADDGEVFFERSAEFAFRADQAWNKSRVEERLFQRAGYQLLAARQSFYPYHRGIIAECSEALEC